MITIFNQKELTITYSMDTQHKVRNILTQHNIPYKIKVLNPGGPLGQNETRRGGTLGINLDYAYEYKIYVRKSDYEEALHLINA